MCGDYLTIYIYRYRYRYRYCVQSNATPYKLSKTLFFAKFSWKVSSWFYHSRNIVMSLRLYKVPTKGNSLLAAIKRLVSLIE